MSNLEEIAKTIISSIPQIQDYSIDYYETKHNKNYVINFKLPDDFTRKQVEEFVQSHSSRIYGIVINSVDFQYCDISIKAFGTPKYRRGFHVKISIPK